MPKLEDAERRPTRKIDAKELRRLVVSLVVTVDEEDKVTPFEGVPAVRAADVDVARVDTDEDVDVAGDVGAADDDDGG